jgi:hypothetical protein
LPPPPPQGRLHRLPPILRNLGSLPASSCSKAPRGLFVLSRVARIFTGTSISPSPSSRQRPDRYAIRAGRNLPDKEFRYLRTVIVTAAVHRGFGSERELLPLTFRHWAGVSPHTSPCGLAETCVFGKQSPGPLLCGLPAHVPKDAPPEAPLLPKLRGQLAEFLDEGSLAHLGALTPTHQCRFPVRIPQPSTTGFSCQSRPLRIALTVVSTAPSPFQSQERTLSSWHARTTALGHRGFIRLG